jgi:GMP synthase (glutamine-hydrolysing)
VREELAKAGLEREIWQSFAVLADVRSVGVMGDERTYEHPIARHPGGHERRRDDRRLGLTRSRTTCSSTVMSTAAIINEVAGVNRVAYDITSRRTSCKPPGQLTIEWE